MPEHRLPGAVSLRDLVLAFVEAPVAALLRRNLQHAQVDEPRSDVATRNADVDSSRVRTHISKIMWSSALHLCCRLLLHAESLLAGL